MTLSLNMLADIFLQGTRIYVIAPIIIFGFLCHNHKLFFKLAGIVFFSSILNTYLKNYWQVPLDPRVGQGYAFPSGHMQIAFVFWGFLAWHFKNLALRIFVGLITLGIGWALVQKGYHIPKDVLASFIAGAIVVFFAVVIDKIGGENEKYFILILFALTGLLMYVRPSPLYAPHVKMYFLGLGAMGLASILPKQDSHLTYAKAVPMVLIFLIPLGVLYYLKILVGFAAFQIPFALLCFYIFYVIGRIKK